MIRIDIEDYDDETLIAELKERGYAVYKNEEMQESIVKLGNLQDLMKRKHASLKRLGGK